MDLPLLEEVEPLELVEAPPKAKKEGKVLLTTKGGRKVTVEDQVALKVKTISEIVAALIQAHNEGKNVNVTKLKSQLSSKNKLTESPKTVDIIAAIPDAYRKVLIPKLKTKPVRTASGVRFAAERAVDSADIVTRLQLSPSCASRTAARTLRSRVTSASTALAVPTRTLSTRRSPTRATNPRACEQSVLATTPIFRPDTVSTSSSASATQ